jgi:hypothetical protein
VNIRDHANSSGISLLRPEEVIIDGPREQRYRTIEARIGPPENNSRFPTQVVVKGLLANDSTGNVMEEVRS